MKMRASLCAAAVTCVVLLCSPGAHAGPITPPPGPVTGTHKTLTEVEPRIAINEVNTPGDADSLFRITSPGSYYLTRSIVGVAGKHGIEIESSGVTLDLNGFDLSGVPGMGAFDGIRSSGLPLRAVVVKNGSVRGWGDDGIDCASSTARGICVEGVSVIGNAGHGMLIAPHGSVTGCEAIGNGSDGILVSDACIVTACVASGNGGRGIIADNGSIVRDCIALENTGNGIETSIAGIVIGCTAMANGGSGIVSNGAGAVVDGCTAYSNTSSGIVVFNGNSVTGCAVRLNAQNGIVATSFCVIRGNTLSSNGSGGDGAGILVTGSDTRIEENNSIGADRGIEVTGTGNVVIRNSCSGNSTDWVIAANNIHGPILDRRVPVSAAVNGFTASSTLGSTDANANYSY